MEALRLSQGVLLYRQGVATVNPLCSHTHTHTRTHTHTHTQKEKSMSCTPYTVISFSHMPPANPSSLTGDHGLRTHSSVPSILVLRERERRGKREREGKKERWRENKTD